MQFDYVFGLQCKGRAQNDVSRRCYSGKKVKRKMTSEVPEIKPFKLVIYENTPVRLRFVGQPLLFILERQLRYNNVQLYNLFTNR